VFLYLFDIDGTLLHAKGSGREAFDQVFEAQHGIANASEGIRYGGKTDPAIIDEIFRARFDRAPTANETAAFLDAYIPRLRALLAQNRVVVIDGVLAALRALAERSDVALGIATGNIRAGAFEKLAAARLVDWFRARDGAPGRRVVGDVAFENGGQATEPARSGGVGGPLDPAIGGYGCDSHVRAELVGRAIERGRERHAVREVIVVGDTIHDISAARACNATVCAVATGADPADKLANADAVFASLAELPAWHHRRYDRGRTA
jgi:phosphoglycolate phosphatase-like HAD superfamily hydrolase